jgi:hypothetical protein
LISRGSGPTLAEHIEESTFSKDYGVFAAQTHLGGLTMNRFLLMMLLASAGLSTIGFSQTYTTRFEGVEDPLSEDGKWTNNGVDWTKIRKKDGLAFGTQTGTNTDIYKFNDSYAHLSGFPPDQEAWGQAYIAKPNSSCIQELEILLRWTSSPHRTTGYECFARCLNSGSSYVQIVRWDGPLGKFTYLADKRGTNYCLKNGDILKASIVGNLITVYINGVEQARATDNTHKTGNPGIGEYLACDGGQGIGSNSDFGFSSFTARGSGGTNGSPSQGNSGRNYRHRWVSSPASLSMRKSSDDGVQEKSDENDKPPRGQPPDAAPADD